MNASDLKHAEQIPKEAKVRSTIEKLALRDPLSRDTYARPKVFQTLEI